MNELEVKDLEVALPGVTVLSYDLDTTKLQILMILLGRSYWMMDGKMRLEISS